MRRGRDLSDTASVGIGGWSGEGSPSTDDTDAHLAFIDCGHIGGPMAKGLDPPTCPDVVDLEARVHALADALASGTAASFLSPRLRVEVAALTFTRDDVLSLLAIAPRVRPVLRTVAVKRNVTFCDGEVPGVGAGVAVLSWDQDGLLTHMTVEPRAKAA